jgi:hypothetical protein
VPSLDARLAYRYMHLSGKSCERRRNGSDVRSVEAGNRTEGATDDRRSDCRGCNTRRKSRRAPRPCSECTRLAAGPVLHRHRLRPDVVANVENREPVVRDEDVAVFAYRDGIAQVRNRSQPLPHDLLALDREQVRRLGVSTAGRAAVAFLTRATDQMAAFGSIWTPTSSTIRSCGLGTIPDPTACFGTTW